MLDLAALNALIGTAELLSRVLNYYPSSQQDRVLIDPIALAVPKGRPEPVAAGRHSELGRRHGMRREGGDRQSGAGSDSV